MERGKMMAGAPEPKSESRMATAPEGGESGYIDPSKNVLDLVRAEGKYQDYARESVAKRTDDLRAAETRRVDQMSNAESRRVDSMLEAETRRQDELRLAEAKSNEALRAQRMTYESRIEGQGSDFQRQMAATTTDFQKQIAAILANQTSKDALLLSQAVDKLGVTTGERLSAVEKNQYLTGGQASVRDPALAETLAGIAATLKVLSTKSSTGEGANSQSEANQKLLFLIVGVVIAGAGIAAGFFH